jgi:L-threonylcarbamoyladenylate synthase
MDSRLLPASEVNIAKAAKNLLNGNLVVFPTETVYGLGASATDKNAVGRIYEVKNRPKDHPLIVHVSSISKVQVWGKEIPNYAMDLASSFWPGPMTLILTRSEIAKDFVTGGQSTIGLRIPKNRIALNLLAQFENIGGLGIAAPSANQFGAVSPTSANHVLQEIENSLSESDLLLDGGSCEIGIESTIIDCSSESPRILRPGAVTLEAIKSVVKSKNLIVEANNKIKYSGIFKSHYSPKAKVFLNTEPRPGDGFIAMDGIETPKNVFRLSTPIDINDFATKIYASLRSADELKLLRVVVITPPNNGLGIAINDRLRKAAEK